MPLMYGETGIPHTIVHIGGSATVRQHLESMGFTAGTPITVVNTLAGNVIVQIKESRVALGRDLANKIFIK